VAHRAVESVGALVELTTDGPVRLQGDPVALERVLTNVLDNAVRHAHSRVGIDLRRGDEAAIAEVIDDGPGFRDEDLPHVFEPLFRGDRARSGGGGAGLGLAIARRLGRAQGGDVTAVSSGRAHDGQSR
jgi:signal transduction histidine kinase